MQYTKTEAGWLLSEYETEEDLIQLGSVNLELELSGICTGINFDDAQST